MAGTYIRLHIVTAGQNWTDIAKIHYEDWYRYQEIIDANPDIKSPPREMHNDPGSPLTGRPPLRAPTLYIGDRINVPMPLETPEEPEPEPEQHREEPRRGNVIEKKWTGNENQTPNPKVEVFLPSNKNSGKPNFTFMPETGTGVLSKLQSYNFVESVDDLEGSFSFTTENGEIKGENIFDLIPIRSIIKIYEGGDHPAFIGIIRRRRFSKQMTGQSINKVINFSGKSIVSIVSEYMVSLDIRIMPVAGITDKNNELTSRLRNTTKIADFIQLTWDYFKEITERINRDGLHAVSNTKIFDTIKNYLGDNFYTASGEEQDINYPVSTPFFNANNNHIADVWRNILPNDVYELFSYCDNKGNAKIMIRMVPFGNHDGSNNDWKNLDMYVICPVSLTSFDLEQNDEDVHTAFISFIVGSPRERNFNMIVRMASQPDDTVEFNDEKMSIYGFRPLEISFLGYDRGRSSDDNSLEETTNAVKKINSLAAYWYSRKDEMYSGTITIITDFNEPRTNPKVGCRAKFLGGEFYINKGEHTWTFGSAPMIKLSVSRGMMYNENGVIRDGEAGVIKDIARKYRELERG